MLNVENCKRVHSFVAEGNWISAGNAVLEMLGRPLDCSTPANGVKICQKLFQFTLDSDRYLEAATLQWGPEMFNTEPESVRRVFDAMNSTSLMLIQGGSSLGKTYGAGGYLLLDYLRDPLYTTVKLAAVNEDHLKKNLFAHVVTLFRACSIPIPHKIIVQDSALWMGIKEAGNEFGISGIAFKQSQDSSGQFKGYKAKPVRKRRHPKFGFMSRLRVLGDECVRGDQRVSMGSGTLVPIKEIVERKLSGYVLSLNKRGFVECKKIVGWHKVPLNGRKMLNVGGVIVTEDHPVFTKKWKFELARDAETCFKIGHEELSRIGAAGGSSAILDSGWIDGGFIDLTAIGKSRQFSRVVYPWGCSAGLPEVEERNNVKLHRMSDTGAVCNGIRWANLQVFNKESSGFHQNPEINCKGRNQEIRSAGKSDGCDGDGGMVHGRWQHAKVQELQDHDINHINLLSSEVRRGCSDLPSARNGGIGKGEAKQGQVGYPDGCLRDAHVFGYSSSIHSPLRCIQIDRDAASEQARVRSDNERSCGYPMPDLRNSISQITPSDNMWAGVQQEVAALARKQEIQEDEFVYCIDVEDNHNFFAEGVCCHNCQNWPNGPFKDFNSLVASITGTDIIKVVCAYNPESLSQHVVQLAEPDTGWGVEDMERLYDWESKAGWQVCRLDAAKCENVIQKKIVYPGLQTYEGFLSYLKAGGDNSSNYCCFGRGWPPIRATVDVIIPPAWPQEARGEAIFIETPTNCGAVDLAFMGKDSAQMAIGRWGKASGWRDQYGKTHFFTDNLNIASRKPRYVLQIDQILPLSKHDNTVTMAEEIIGRCRTLEINPEWLAVDKTGYGFGVHSHLAKVWGDCFGVSWNEKATDKKILAEDQEAADVQCDGVMSEMWWAFRRWLEPSVRAILINPIIPPNPIQTQLTTRRYKAGSTKGIKVEKKEEYMARNAQVSPDESDALVMLCHVVRRNSDVIPGLSEQSQPGKNINGRDGIKWQSLKAMVSVEAEDSICATGEDD